MAKKMAHRRDKTFWRKKANPRYSGRLQGERECARRVRQGLAPKAVKLALNVVGVPGC
jgi:hypothetical protein